MNDNSYFYVFNGPYSEYCKKFVDYKRSLGFKICEPYCHRLWEMDILFSSFFTHKDNLIITKEMAETYVALRDNESVKTQHLRMSTIRQFALFMNRIGFEFYVYPKTAFVKVKEDFIPYIFTHEEITSIIDILGSIPMSARYPKNHLIYPMLFRLLYACGLRIGEAITLRMSDLDLEYGISLLTNTKNQRQRVVPMSKSLHEYCKRYICEMGFKNENKEFLFPSTHKEYGSNRHLSSKTAYSRLKKIMTLAGVHKEDGQTPRIHDIRHTFAVHALEKMVSEGRDIYCALPTLSTYLGHRGIESTEKYLRLTQESFKDVISEMDTYYDSVFPEVNCYEK